jgi:hypothetical protein
MLQMLSEALLEVVKRHITLSLKTDKIGSVYFASQLYIANAHPVNSAKTCTLVEIASDACRHKIVQNVIME